MLQLIQQQSLDIAAEYIWFSLRFSLSYDLSFPPYFKLESIISRALFHFSQHTSAPGCYQVNWPRISEFRIFYGGWRPRESLGYIEISPSHCSVSFHARAVSVAFCKSLKLQQGQLLPNWSLRTPETCSRNAVAQGRGLWPATKSLSRDAWALWWAT